MITIINYLSSINGLTERILSIFFFYTILLVICLIISRTNNYKYIKKILLVYLIILIVLSIMFVPSPSLDLYRLINIDVNNLRSVSFELFIQRLPSKVNYTTYIIMFLASRIDFPGFLPFVATTIFYSIVFYILYDYSKNNNISGSSVAKSLLFFMSTGQFGEVISGIRCMSSFAICAFIIYREIYQKKSFLMDIPLYIIAIGFHSACIPIILIRTVSLLFQKENRIIYRTINILFFGLILYYMLNYGSEILNATFDKATKYLTKDAYYYFWEQLGTIIAIAMLGFMLLCNKKKGILKVKLKNINFHNYKIISYIFLLLVIIFNFIEFNTFNRFSRLVFILFIPFILEFFNSLPKHNNKLLISKNELLYNSMLLFLILIETGRAGLNILRFF